jgi:hypothetical protein
MPPLVGVAIAAAASSFGVGGLIAGTIAELGVGTIVADVAAGAIIGAAAGVGTSLAAGTDPGNGALWGAIGGGATAGLTPGVESVTGLGTDASQAIASGIVTTGSAAAQGAPIDKALQYGATAGVGSYAGSQLIAAITPDPTEAPKPLGPNPDGSPATGPSVSAPLDPLGASTTGPGEQAVVESTKVAPPQTNSIFLPSGEEQATKTETRPKDQSIFDIIQQHKGAQAAEKGALTTALFSFLFPQGGNQYASAGGGASSAPPASGSRPVGAGSAGGPGGAGSVGGGVGGATPAAVAAQAAASGQTGSTSGYAPGSPILTSPEGATKYSPWNVESLRTAPGVA